MSLVQQGGTEMGSAGSARDAGEKHRYEWEQSAIYDIIDSSGLDWGLSEGRCISRRAK